MEQRAGIDKKSLALGRSAHFGQRASRSEEPLVGPLAGSPTARAGSLSGAGSRAGQIHLLGPAILDRSWSLAVAAVLAAPAGTVLASARPSSFIFIRRLRVRRIRLGRAQIASADAPSALRHRESPSAAWKRSSLRIINALAGSHSSHFLHFHFHFHFRRRPRGLERPESSSVQLPSCRPGGGRRARVAWNNRRRAAVLAAGQPPLLASGRTSATCRRRRRRGNLRASGGSNLYPARRRTPTGRATIWRKREAPACHWRPVIACCVVIRPERCAAHRRRAAAIRPSEPEPASSGFLFGFQSRANHWAAAGAAEAAGALGNVPLSARDSTGPQSGARRSRLHVLTLSTETDESAELESGLEWAGWRALFPPQLRLLRFAFASSANADRCAPSRVS